MQNYTIVSANCSGQCTSRTSKTFIQWLWCLQNDFLAVHSRHYVRKSTKVNRYYVALLQFRGDLILRVCKYMEHLMWNQIFHLMGFKLAMAGSVCIATKKISLSKKIPWSDPHENSWGMPCSNKAIDHFHSADLN